MKALQRWSAFLAASISVALGVASLAPADRHLPREPAWIGVVAPLAHAPVPPGARVLLAEGRDAPRDQSLRLLRESAWQRPDLYLALAEDVPPSFAPDAIVTVGDASPPANWRPVWHEGMLTIWRRGSR